MTGVQPKYIAPRCNVVWRRSGLFGGKTGSLFPEFRFVLDRQVSLVGVYRLPQRLFTARPFDFDLDRSIVVSQPKRDEGFVSALKSVACCDAGDLAAVSTRHRHAGADCITLAVNSDQRELDPMMICFRAILEQHKRLL